MFLRGLLTAIASVGMIAATPAIAAPTSASLLSLGNARVGASHSTHSNKLTASTALIGILVFAGIVGAVYAVADSSDQPGSP